MYVACRLLSNFPTLFFTMYRCDDDDKYITNIKKLIDDDKLGKYYCSIFTFGLARLAAAFGVIPFLFLQLLDCYQWICLSEMVCGDLNNQYRLSLIQASISLTFIVTVFILSYSTEQMQKPTPTLYARFNKK